MIYLEGQGEKGGDNLKIRKGLIIAVLATFCLTSTLFTTIITTSQPVPGQYDPWIDLNDDGVIDGVELGYLGATWLTTGTPINKTAKLLELQARINSLNISCTEHGKRIDDLETYVLALEAYLNAKISDLNATLLSEINSLNLTLTSRVNCLETKIAEMNATIISLEDRVDLLNATKLKAEPDWDSGWVTLPAGEVTPFTHNLNTTNVLVYMIGKDIDGTYDIHQWKFGTDDNGWSWLGTGWLNLTETTIKVGRQKDDAYWDQVRIMIWKIPES
jgi:hypothetical protein